MKPSRASLLPSAFFRDALAVGVAIAALAAFFTLSAGPVLAETPEELEAKIAQKNSELQKLEAEIAEYEKQLDTIGTARKTLEGEIQRLDVSRKKITTDIAVTQNRIATANLKLGELEQEITDKEKRIEGSRAAIGASLRVMGQLEKVTLAEHFLAGETFNDGWEEADRLGRIQEELVSAIDRLATTKKALTENLDAISKEERQLSSFKNQLSGQKSILDQNRKTHATVLGETKNKESEYQKILDEKRAQQQAFEQELRDYQSAIDYSFDSAKIPNPGTGVIRFPLDTAYMARCVDKEKAYGNIYCISQYFGNTAFAKSGAYNGAGHNGIDFGAAEGTKVVAALPGVVEETGNTDLVKGCYSYGKWILVRHGNGLMTMYAHLSSVNVVKGSKLEGGEFIGYSGKTGYATGPHLHFMLFAADGVQIVRLGDIKTKTNCANALVPIAPTAAYLNPISYL